MDGELVIRIEKHLLSDHSEVFDVVFGGARLHAIDQDAAAALAEALASAINEYSCDDARVAF